MTESNSSESSPIMNAPKDSVNNESEAHILTQEEVNEQMKN